MSVDDWIVPKHKHRANLQYEFIATNVEVDRQPYWEVTDLMISKLFVNFQFSLMIDGKYIHASDYPYGYFILRHKATNSFKITRSLVLPKAWEYDTIAGRDLLSKYGSVWNIFDMTYLRNLQNLQYTLRFGSRVFYPQDYVKGSFVVKHSATGDLFVADQNLKIVLTHQSAKRQKDTITQENDSDYKIATVYEEPNPEEFVYTIAYCVENENPVYLLLKMLCNLVMSDVDITSEVLIVAEDENEKQAMIARVGLLVGYNDENVNIVLVSELKNPARFIITTFTVIALQYVGTLFEVLKQTDHFIMLGKCDKILRGEGFLRQLHNFCARNKELYYKMELEEQNPEALLRYFEFLFNDHNIGADIEKKHKKLSSRSLLHYYNEMTGNKTRISPKK